MKPFTHAQTAASAPASALPASVAPVERLDRVVRSVLDYARPKQGDFGLVNVNAVVDQTSSADRPKRSQLGNASVSR